MNVKSCQFVEATEVFKDCMKAYDIFCVSEPDCSWGDNNRTMVSRDVIVNAIESFSDVDDEEDDSNSTNEQVKKVFERLNNLNVHTYIDLEN
jgi:hypothetical protein